MSAIEFDLVPLITKSNLADEQKDLPAFLLFDKPFSWSSFRGVKLIRWASGIKKVGHAGTLDPMATGLLIVGIGKGATKHIDLVQAQTKEYIATIKFGEATASYDAETEVITTKEFTHITKASLEEVLETHFLGEIEQKPPIYSALKKDGKKLYEYARKGQEVEIASRKVHLISIEILRFELPEVEIKITCGKGTYIRSLAHDLGIALDSVAHLIQLRRTKIGDFDVSLALNEAEVKAYFGKVDHQTKDL